ncbi:hypothetical protein K458DRAFT_426536 [Lentithecium fluviatile CBS 122367]|uniref:Uncharacterized protein n=1 Tax=Lentithecium fluviatile CBS 122367 TaxID=1168545 RepID=A0A6G1JLR6_9PLEO|nr:hypothetical protein K458DRAFT_426536 [Lentithecium fluviatile CBS 122367]
MDFSTPDNRPVTPIPSTGKSIDDLYREQQESESSPSGRSSNGASTDQGMAHLHALLTKGPSEKLQRAQSRALAQKQCYSRANQIRTNTYNKEFQVFPFLALPTELRLAVYFELLVTNDRLVVTWRGPRKANKQQKRMYTGILRASKQCRDEGLTVLYGENIFDMEEICNRPLSVAKPFLKHIGPHNASLIRIVIAEYSAAAEELHQLDPVNTPTPTDPLSTSEKPQSHLTLSFLTSTLSTFNIILSHLRALALNIIPYGHDHATQDLMRQQAPLVVNNMRARVAWLDTKNNPERLGKVVEGICERESGLVKADYWKDVDAWVGFWWSSPFMGREWVVYKGVRAREEGDEMEGVE